MGGCLSGCLGALLCGSFSILLCGSFSIEFSRLGYTVCVRKVNWKGCGNSATARGGLDTA